jgi:hypothetical protein
MKTVEISADRFATLLIRGANGDVIRLVQRTLGTRWYRDAFLSAQELQRVWDEGTDGDALFALLQLLSPYHNPVNKDGARWIPWVYVYHKRRAQGWLPSVTADQLRSLIRLSFK